MARTRPFALLNYDLPHPQAKRAIAKIVDSVRSESRRRFRSALEREALIDAIRYGRRQIVGKLLKLGFDPCPTEPVSRSVLWHASRLPDSGDLIRALVKRGAKLPDDVLMGPVDDGDESTVRFLIRHGANVNCVATFTRYSSKFPSKQVLLTMAIESAGRCGQPESIPICLIKAGAEVNRLAFTYSLFRGFIRSILGLAVNFGLVKTVKALLASGADVNFQDSWGGTPLFEAALKGNVKIASLLLEAGAFVDLTRKDGKTALSIAKMGGHHGIVRLLEQNL